MWPIVIDVLWFVSVSLLVTAISYAKTAEPVEMLFGCGLGLAQETMWIQIP